MKRSSFRPAQHMVACMLIMISLIIAAIAPLTLGATASAAQDPAPRLRAVAVTIGEADLAWSAAANVGVAQYRIYRNDQVLAIVTSATLVYVDSTVQVSTVYIYRVEALDAAGRSLATSNQARVKMPGRPETSDTTAPSPPEELSVVAGNGYNFLDWDDASDDTDVTAYRIYRDGKLLATVDSGTRSYMDSNVKSGVSYSYTLEGIDTVGHRSSPIRAVAKARGQLAAGQLSAPSAGTASVQLVSGSTVNAAISAAAYGASLRRYPYLTDVVVNYATINWATDQSGTTGSAQWGQVAPDGTCTPNTTVTATRKNLTVNSVSEYQWKAQLTLAPDTKYCYRVYLGSTDLLGADPTPQFWTQVPAGSNEPFTFAVLGDWGSVDSTGANPDQANLMQQIAASGARFALATGDTGYSSGSQLNYGDLVQTGSSISGVFGPLFWTVAGAKIPLFPATGNHGYASTNTEHPYLLNWPQDRAAATSNGRYIRETYCCLNGTISKSYPSAWYAFDAGNARFYVLTASWDEGNLGTADQYKNDYDNHWTPSGAQYQWLEHDLATHPAALKFAFFHYPLHSDNTAQESDAYLQGANSLEGLLGHYGVDIAFNGHAHIYQRNQPAAGGLVSHVTGGGGAKAASVRACSALDAYGIGWSYSSNEGTACGSASPPPDPSYVYHFLRVTVNGTQVTVEPTDELGRTFDVQTFDFGGGGDTQAPSAPTNVSATAASATQVDLSWTAATDNVGVTGYEIYRDGGLLTSVGAQTSYSDISVTAGTSYSYQLKAFDAAGNRSAFSTSASVTTPAAADTTPPSAPTNVSATAASATQVNLSWTAATDNVGVTGYEIYRNGGLLTSVGAQTSYSDISVTAGTSYSYQLKAFDAAGNRSAFSNTATVTTPSGGTPTTSTFAAEADAYVDATIPTSNFGIATRLYADGSPSLQSYLRFTVTGVAGRVQSAKLRLYVSDGTTDGPQIYATSNTWSETGITWNTKPATSGTASDDKGAITTNTWVEFDVTPLVVGNGTYSFVLVPTSSDGVNIYSREATTIANRPQLVVTQIAP